MRIKLLSFFMMILGVTNAQNLTLTKAAYEPVVGDSKGSYPLDTTFYTTGLPTNITGTAVTWDFSNLILNPTVTLVSSDYVSPASTTVTPPAGATIAEDQNGSYTFYKSVSTPSTQFELQSIKFGTIALTFTNTAIMASWPIAYGYSLADPVAGSVQFSISANFNGNITTTADGMGTLLMPQSNTFNNVLRVKSVQSLAITVGPLPVGNVKQTIYQYYHSSSKFPILSVTSNATTLGTQTTEVTTATGNSSFLAIGIKENQLNKVNFNVLPNPANTSVSIELEKNKVANSLTLINAVGQEVKRIANSNTLHVSEVANGIYYLEVSSEGHSARKPVVISH